jgi:hypothetical protein
MRKHMAILLFLLGIVVTMSACATSEQWAEWRAHSTHFASGDHLWFSLENRGATPRVTQRDIQAAKAQSWWGDPVVVRPDQIFGRVVGRSSRS